MDDIVPPANSPGARLHPDVWREVVSFIDPDALVLVSQVDRLLRDLALMRDWNTVDESGHITQLFYYMPEHRQSYANRIRELHVSIHDRFDFTALTFPALNRLNINEDLLTDDDQAFMTIDQFIQPALESLNLGDIKQAIDPGNGIVSNILPLLACRTPYLQDLTLAITMPTATSEQLLAALQGCPLLRRFVLLRDSATLMSPNVFAHLALQTRLEELDFDGVIDHQLLRNNVAVLPTYRDIFEHLTIANLSVDLSAAKALFSRMKVLRTLTLSISKPSNILTHVARMPRLTKLEICCIEDMPLTDEVLWGLQQMNLEQLVISADDGVSIDGSEIEIDQLDNLFGSHQTLRKLEFAWEGHPLLPSEVSFLQHSPHLVIEKVARFYPNVTSLCLPFPCAAIDILRTTHRPLNMGLKTLIVDQIARPPQTPHPIGHLHHWNTIVRKIDAHFPVLENLWSAEDHEVTTFVIRGVRALRQMRNCPVELRG